MQVVKNVIFECNLHPNLSQHAQIRAQQRSFTLSEIEYILENGRILERSGVYHYHLTLKDIPASDRKLGWVSSLVGATVLVNRHTGKVITLYRGTTLRDIKKLSKFHSHYV